VPGDRRRLATTLEVWYGEYERNAVLALALRGGIRAGIVSEWAAVTHSLRKGGGSYGEARTVSLAARFAFLVLSKPLVKDIESVCPSVGAVRPELSKDHRSKS
jgi:hypothetical protein